MRRGFIILFVVLILLASISYMFIFKTKEILMCGDRTFYNKCSVNTPYYCEKGQLVEKAFVCNCPDNMYIEGEICMSDYKTGVKELQLKYSSGGELFTLSFLVYEGVYDYLSELPRSINGNNLSLVDLKLVRIDNSLQKNFLLPLVVSIQNLDKDKEVQAEIAISIVQNIDFDGSDKILTFGDMEVDYQRYPYEALYEEEGVCSEKSDLLAFLLKELGFDVAIFHFVNENHEAVGIKCEKGDFQDSGYCYIETTTDQKVVIFSEPIIVSISEGESVEDI